MVLASTGTSAPGSRLASPTESPSRRPPVPPISLDHEDRVQLRRAQNPRVADGAAQRERRTRRVLAGERRGAAPHASPPPPPGAVCDASCDPIDAQCVDALARRTAVPVSEAARVRWAARRSRFLPPSEARLRQLPPRRRMVSGPIRILIYPRRLSESLLPDGGAVAQSCRQSTRRRRCVGPQT